MRFISLNLNGIRSASCNGVVARLAELSLEEGGVMRVRQRAPMFSVEAV